VTAAYHRLEAHVVIREGQGEELGAHALDSVAG
jgi:hypothetical protein